MGFVHFFHEALLKPSVINTGVKSSCRRPRLSPTNFFPLKKRYQQKDTYVLLSNICSLIFIPKAFDGNEFPTSEENIGITSSFGIEFSLNTFWGSLSFQQLHRPTAKPPADRTCVRTSFAPTLIGVTRVVGARPRGGGRKLLSFTG